MRGVYSTCKAVSAEATQMVTLTIGCSWVFVRKSVILAFLTFLNTKVPYFFVIMTFLVHVQ